jgi:hypothetical protein
MNEDDLPVSSFICVYRILNSRIAQAGREIVNAMVSIASDRGRVESRTIEKRYKKEQNQCEPNLSVHFSRHLLLCLRRYYALWKKTCVDGSMIFSYLTYLSVITFANR